MTVLMTAHFVKILQICSKMPVMVVKKKNNNIFNQMSDFPRLYNNKGFIQDFTGTQHSLDVIMVFVEMLLGPTILDSHTCSHTSKRKLVYSQPSVQI